MPVRPLFDPESLPLEAPGLQAVSLPVVPASALTPEALRDRFARRHALEWAPERLEATRFDSADLRQAAVLMPLVVRPQGLSVLLTHRAAHLTDHAGQISFPGGRRDPDDQDAVDTALREAWEEVALPRACVEPLGNLPDYMTGTGYAVTPVVALVHPPFTVRACDREVAEVFEVPLRYLMDPGNHQIRIFAAGPDSRRFFSMPYPRETGEGEHFIWGATAGMLRNLYRFLLA